MSEGQQSAGGNYVNKARDAARKDPAKTRGYIDKAAGFLKKRAGSKHGSKIDKGADFIGGKLGVQEQKSSGGTGQSGQSGQGGSNGQSGQSGQGGAQRSE